MIALSKLPHQLMRLHNSRYPRVIRIDFEDFIDNYADAYETTKHYVCKCPYCIEQDGYEKNKLYIEKDSLDRGFCQHCKSIFFNYTTDLSFEIFSKKKTQTDFKLSLLPSENPNPGGKDNSLAAYNNCPLNREELLELLSERDIDSPYVRKQCNSTQELIQRNISRYSEIIDTLGLRGCKVGENNGLIMFPFYIDNKLIYWQSKLIGYELKYYMPPIVHKPFYIPCYRGNKIVIVEGIFDAIACLKLYPDRTPIAILGSYVTDYHIWLLRNYIQPTDCLISLDNIHLSIQVLFQLKGMIPTIVNYDLYYGPYDVDPSELLLSMSDSQLEEFINTHRYEDNFEWE